MNSCSSQVNFERKQTETLRQSTWSIVLNLISTVFQVAKKAKTRAKVIDSLN